MQERPGLGVKLVFWQSTVNLRHRGTVGGAKGAKAAVIYLFLVMISTAMAQG
jgi:hypothetical protein